MLQLDIQNQFDTISFSNCFFCRKLQLDIQNQFDTIYPDNLLKT